MHLATRELENEIIAPAYYMTLRSPNYTESVYSLMMSD